MSTHCYVGVHGVDLAIYKHSDGYPQYVLPRLLPLIKAFIAARGKETFRSDPGAFLFYACSHFHQTFVKEIQGGYSDGMDDFRLESPGEVACRYFYKVLPTGDLAIYESTPEWDWKRVMTVINPVSDFADILAKLATIS